MMSKKIVSMLIGLFAMGLIVGCSGANSEIVENLSSPFVEEIQSEKLEESEEILSEIVEESETIGSEEEIASEEQVEEKEKSVETEEESTVEEAESQAVKREYHWILNTNTKKVHTEKCSSVSDIKEKNKSESDLSPDELKAKGYSACGKCKPF